MDENKVIEPEKNKKKEIKQAIVNTISIILFVLTFVILLLGVVSIRAGKRLSLFGYSYSIISSPSMEPILNTCDFILINEKIQYEDLKEGDIIVYYNAKEDKHIVHRIVDKSFDSSNNFKGFITKGDNNSMKDTIIVTKDIYEGRVVGEKGHLNWLGKLVLEERWIFFFILIIIFGYMMFSESFNIFKTIKEEKTKTETEKIEQNKEEELAKLREEMKEQLRKELEEQNKNNSNKIE